MAIPLNTFAPTRDRLEEPADGESFGVLDRAPRREEIAGRLQSQLMESIRLRVTVDVRDPGGVPRQEIGKAKRVFERTGPEDPVG